MTIYDNLRATATKLLTKYGQIVTLSRETVSSYDPVLGVPTSSTAEYTGYAAMFDYQLSEIDGQTIQRGDARLLLQVISIEPKNGDNVTVNGIQYSVINATILAPGGAAVVYELQLRR